MNDKTLEDIWGKIRLLMKSHPWHGVPIGKNFPRIVTTYIDSFRRHCVQKMLRITA